MADSMSMARLVEDLERLLMDSAKTFDSVAFILTNALLMFSRVKKRTLAGTVALVAGQSVYDCPDDFIGFGASYWGHAKRASIKPWEIGYPSRLPRVVVIESHAGKQLMFDIPPTRDQISRLGAEYPFTYQASHRVDDTGDETTVAESDRDLLLLAAQAEAMRMMANRNIKKPVASRDVIGGQSRNGTPAALHELYLNQFRMLATC